MFWNISSNCHSIIKLFSLILHRACWSACSYPIRSFIFIEDMTHRIYHFQHKRMQLLKPASSCIENIYLMHLMCWYLCCRYLQKQMTNVLEIDSAVPFIFSCWWSTFRRNIFVFLGIIKWRNIGSDAGNLCMIIYV